MSTQHWGDDYAHGAPPRVRHRGHRKWPWVLLAAVLLLAAGCAAIVVVLAGESDKKVRVRYEVTGDAKGVAIAYTTWQGGGLVTQKEGPRDLPWRKELETTGFEKGGVLAVTTGKGGGTVSCSVTVDDGQPRTATASGRETTATCTGF
ncbi:hypothetical protein [Streptomyces rectiverticillatus]|uniref:hypothetical protein n=1 Tax=Streptomyces rectiverticillatus TaxID=173860 RepID=UPI0015C3DAE8|nr:hypothetical protein [Streptomyces rectiverticillatus]